jgi:hypothetical protein
LLSSSSSNTSSSSSSSSVTPLSLSSPTFTLRGGVSTVPEAATSALPSQLPGFFATSNLAKAACAASSDLTGKPSGCGGGKRVCLTRIDAVSFLLPVFPCI